MESLPLKPNGADMERRELCSAMLRSQFHITSAFVPVKTIAAIIGMSPATLYGYIRNDAFFMPYRRINKTPVVELEDLVEWYCSDEKIIPGASKRVIWISDDTPRAAKRSPPPQAPVKGKDSGRRMDVAVQEALKELGLAGSIRRSRQK